MSTRSNDACAQRRADAGDPASESSWRRFVAARLREREQQLEAVLSGVRDAVIGAGQDGTVAFMNPVAEALTGWPEQEARGKPFADVLRCAEPGVLIARSGARILIEVSAASGAGGDAGRVLVFREIEHRAAAEREHLLREERAARIFAERSVARIGHIQALTSALSWSPRLADVVDAALAGGEAALGADFAAVYLYSRGRATLDLAGQTGFDGALVSRMLSHPADGVGPEATAARTGEAEWLDGPEDLLKRTALGPLLVAAGLQAAAFVPLPVDGLALGVMLLGFRGRRTLSREERSFALSAAEQCAQALDRALVHAEAERAADRTSRLQEVTAAFSEACTPVDVTGVVITRGCDAFGAPRGLVGLLTEDGTALDMVQVVDYPPEVVAAMQMFPMTTDAPLTEAARTGEALFFESPGILFARYPHLRGQRQPRDKALAAIPLAVRGRVLGAMGLVFDEPRAFSNEDRAFMLALGRQCAQALERARLYEAAARERAAAEAANRAKDDFLSTLSHELRTPLTAILGWADILRTRRPDAVASGRALEIIDRNARTLAHLIDDILDVSRIVTRKLRLELGTVDPATVIRAAVDVVRPAADARRIAIDPVIDAGVGSIVADPGRLQQIAWNLLSNAVKFSPAGSRIEVRLTRADAGVSLQVKDAGNGIEQSFLPHVFERFRQADGSSSRSIGGLGLGLAIVKHLVDLHEGTVTAESEGAGRGATFTVTLPARPRLPHDPRPPGVADPADPGGAAARRLDGVRVVLVDDEQDTRDLVAAILRDEGASVTVASTALEALCAFKFERPDVFISDIAMPDEDGYALLGRVRALTADQDRKVPALALTAFAGVEDAKMAARAGFQRHLAKPMTPALLIDAVARLVAAPP
jgi:signal transduction histidine kinase/ActR/RegA family two-component response regulator